MELAKTPGKRTTPQGGLVTVAWNCAWISDQLKLVLRCSPLLRNLRCYGEHIVPVSCARVLVTCVVLEAHFAGFDFDYLANSIIGGNLTNLFTLEIFVRITPRWPNPPRQNLDPVRGLRSELVILSTKASLTPSGTAPLQNLRIVLSELTFPLEKGHCWMHLRTWIEFSLEPNSSTSKRSASH